MNGCITMDLKNKNMEIKLNYDVICINTEPLAGNTIAPPLVADLDYKILEVHTCKCGKEHYNVGLKLVHNYVTCYDCKEELPFTTHWCHPSRFKLKSAE